MRGTAAHVPNVLLVGDGQPARGGVATFLETLFADLRMATDVDVAFLNTTRRAVWRGGRLSLYSVMRAVADAARLHAASRRADLVHLHTALLPALPLIRTILLARSARLAGARVICHVHTGQLNEGPHESFRPGPFTRFLLRRLAFVDAVVAVCRAGAPSLRRYVPDTPVFVIDNGVDVGQFGVARPDRETPVIVYVGALARRKGVLDLLCALRILEEQGCRNWRLEVLGGANQRGMAEAARVRSAFRSEGREGSLSGETDLEGIRAALASSDVLVLPSYSEGQPIAVLEAMASGLPVVASRVGGIPDLVRDRIDGLIVDPGCPDALAAALHRLLSSPDLRGDLGAAARQRVAERFTTAKLSGAVRQLYRFVLSGTEDLLGSDQRDDAVSAIPDTKAG